MSSTLHCVHGYIAVGKTTFARELARERNALLLSLDEWIVSLVGDGARPDPTFRPSYSGEEMRAFADRLQERFWHLIAWQVTHDTEVVLDWGFWKRSDRDALRERARRMGVPCVLYHVVCSSDRARMRLRRRNEGLSPDPYSGGTFLLSEEAYDELAGLFEPLGPDEPHVTVSPPATAPD
jgi:predicted kinase